MEHFCKVTELTFANTNQTHFEKTKDTSNHSAFVIHYTSNYNWLAVIDEQFINDNFNLYGIHESIPNFNLVLKILKGEINLNTNFNKNFNDGKNINNANQSNILNPNQNINNFVNNNNDNNKQNFNLDPTQQNVDNNNNALNELPDNIEQICIDAYNLMHARFIQTPKGLQIMRRKFEAGIFGTCPRFLCNGQNLLPFGSSMMNSKAPARGYCPLCHDIYESDVLIEEQLEIQRKMSNIPKIDDSNEESENLSNNKKSDDSSKIQNKNNNESSNSSNSDESTNNSDADSEGKQSKSTNNNNNNETNDNNNENANLSESTEVANNNQKNEDQNNAKNDQPNKNKLHILDGCCFGPYFPHFFLQMNRDLIPTTFEPSEKSKSVNSNVFSTISSKKSPDWKQNPTPAPYAKSDQMKYSIFGIPIDPNSDFNPHRVIRDKTAFESS